MKKLLKNNLFAAILMISASPAMAAVGTREDNSMTLVYLFLATCGLIIFLQLIPVFALLYGMVKGVLHKKESQSKPAPVKYR